MVAVDASDGDAEADEMLPAARLGELEVALLIPGEDLGEVQVRLAEWWPGRRGESSAHVGLGVAEVDLAADPDGAVAIARARRCQSG